MNELRVLLCWLMWAQPELAYSRTYIVSPDGESVAAGTLESPLKSINAAVANANAGDTVQVRSGTYVEDVKISRSGTASLPLKISAYPGETPVIDGENKIPSGEYGSLIVIFGNYVEVSGFEVRNSKYYGIQMLGHHTVVRNCNIHHSYSVNLVQNGDYSLTENNQIWESNRAVLSLWYKGWGAGVTASRDQENGIADFSVMRGNIVYHNWGEGISTFEANGTVMEDNISHDNWQVNFYISDATNILAQRNLVYSTDYSRTHFAWDGPCSAAPCRGPARGIAMANETARNPLSNVTIINNLVYGTSAPFVYFVNEGPNALMNALIANNTFVNGTTGHAGSGVTVVFGAGAYNNVRFINNVVVQDDASSVVFIAKGQTGLSMSHNLWSKMPQGAAASLTDVVGNALLARTGWEAILPAATGSAPRDADSQARVISPEGFRPLAGSPALGKAISLGEVKEDYFKSPRGATSALGAIASPAK